MIKQYQLCYGRASENKIDRTKEHGIDGARMLMESFYYAFNHRDLTVLKQVWAEHDLIQLNNPLGGILRRYEPIAALYSRIFSGAASVWVELDDIVEFETENMIVFAGREHGEFTLNNQTIALTIRTSRIVQWFGADVGWRQVHHHGSIDDPQLLEAYQQAVRAG